VSYRAEIDDAAKRALRRLDGPVRRRCWDRIVALQDDPRPAASQALRGTLRPLRKLRVGDYRIVYAVDDEARLIRVAWVGHRSRAYEDLERRR